jgi:hypothetical protein
MYRMLEALSQHMSLREPLSALAVQMTDARLSDSVSSVQGARALKSGEIHHCLHQSTWAR